MWLHNKDQQCRNGKCSPQFLRCNCLRQQQRMHQQMPGSQSLRPAVHRWMVLFILAFRSLSSSSFWLFHLDPAYLWPVLLFGRCWFRRQRKNGRQCWGLYSIKILKNCLRYLHLFGTT
jgi:hypothetical protein